MAEPDVTDNTDQNQLARVQEYIRGEVQQYLQGQQQQAQQQYAQQAAQQQQGQLTPQQQAYQQVGQFVRHFVQPDIDQAKFAAADATDRANFYISNPLAKEYEQELEETYATMVQLGRPTVRADVLRYIRGKEYEANPQKFLEKEKEREKRRIQHVSYASDIGASAISRERVDQLFTDFDKLSLEDMEKRLDGVTF